LPGATQTTIQKFGLVPERVTASIRIPRSIFRTIWMAENPPAAGGAPLEPGQEQLDAIELRETQAIEDMVAALLPSPPPGVASYPLVTVSPYTSTPIDDPPVTSLAGNAGSWFAGNWQTIALFGVALFSVFFLRGMIQSNNPAPAVAADAGSREPTLVDHGYDDEEVDQLEITNSLKAKFQHTGRSLRDELTELVHEDPDAAANVLANWIGDAA
jgi:flagellar M-ring protein FliF